MKHHVSFIFFLNYCNHSCCIHCAVHHLLTIMNKSMEENQNKQTQSKETTKPKTQAKKNSQSETDNHHAYRYKEPHLSLSLSLSLRVFLNSCCSNTTPEFTLVAAASPSSIMAQQHHPKTKIAQKNKKKWKQISTLTSNFTYSFQLGSKVELLLPLLLLVLLSSSSSSSAMDSSSITNTNKRRQQQQSTTINNKRETNPPFHKQTQQKNSLSLQKLQVLHQHQILTPIFFFFLDYFFCRIASFASTQFYEIFWSNKHINFSCSQLEVSRYHQVPTRFSSSQLGNLSYLPTKFFVSSCWQPVCSPTWQPFC